MCATFHSGSRYCSLRLGNALSCALAVDVWGVLLEKEVEVTALEDNEATLQIVRAGKNPTLRLTPRMEFQLLGCTVCINLVLPRSIISTRASQLG